ncbi:class IV adenylate cyclase [Acidicapsa ligni]|uniref:class IV adenylate cyclase n=1 Tax=Acidicapsa ligni TaxID=542300 RepID=UPI0021E0A911|nr:class IV adenylate cyclase [Acidicapsa ligni]
MAVVETEIKFRVTDKVDLEAQLSALGFHLVTPRNFESNTLYDTLTRELRAKRELVRIRSYAGRWILTHKRIPDSGVGEDRHKHRVETETEVSDGESLAVVFQSIGLMPVFRYEKWRTEWADDEGHCVVDETPVGNFAELEGTPDWIDRIAAQLGIAQEERMTLSYGRLFDQWRERTGSTAENLTFSAVGEIVS